MLQAGEITFADGTVLTVNRAFTDITGYMREDVLGLPEKAIRNALQPPEFYDEAYAAVQREGYWSGSTWARRKNGAVYREWRSVRPVRNAGGEVTHYVVVFCEVGGAAGPAHRPFRGGASGSPSSKIMSAVILSLPSEAHTATAARAIVR